MPGSKSALQAKLFHICTITNHMSRYEAMKASFITAGFDEGRCRYTCLDNTRKNVHEPYGTINRVRSSSPEPYLIFCHHDVLLDQGDGCDLLLRRIAELAALDSRWAVLGNAGVNADFEVVAKISDPWNTPVWRGAFPQRVHSLDENFLVLNNAAGIGCSPELEGFHFYGTDLCLNAIRGGRACYVIDFHLTHLSQGLSRQGETPDFLRMRTLFRKRWEREFAFCYVSTTCTNVFLSKYPPLRMIFGTGAMTRWFLCNPRTQKWRKAANALAGRNA